MVVLAGCVEISGWSLVAHAGSSSAWANVVCVTNPVIRPLWSAACAAGILAVLVLVELLVTLLERGLRDGSAQAGVVVGLELLQRAIAPVLIDWDVI